MRFAIALLIVASFVVADEPKPWKGEKVLPKKRVVEFSEDGTGTTVAPGTYEYKDQPSIKVVEEDATRIRIDDGQRKGWTPRSEWLQSSEASEYFEGRVKTDAKDVFARSMRAWGNRYYGESDGSINELTECIRLEPSQALHFGFRAHCWFGKNDFVKAIKDFDEALRLDPKNVYWLYSRGLAYDRHHDYEKAVKDYGEAIRLDPKYANAYNNRANAWSQLGKRDEALKDYTEAIHLAPKDAIVFSNRGDEYCKAKRYDDAIKDYTEAIRFAPKGENLAAFFLTARSLAWMGRKDYDKALEDCNEAIRLDSKDVYNFGIRATTFAKVRKFDKALEDFERAENSKIHPSLPRRYAWFLATCPDGKYRDGAKAVKLAKAAIEKAGRFTDWEYTVVLAAAFAETGDFDGAVREQKVVLADKTLDKDDKDEQEKRLKLYEAKKPYRDE